MINLRFDGTNRQRVEACSAAAGRFARKLLQNTEDYKAVELLGPAKALWEKIKGRYRYQMLIKGSDLKSQRLFAAKVMAYISKHAKAQGVRLSADIDPVFIL